MISSVAENARMRKIWREVSRVMYIRWRLVGSWEVWFWLARIIRGRSQQVNTMRGVDKGSVAIIRLRLDQPISSVLISHVKLIKAMSRLWPKVVGHSHFAGTIHAVGINIIVGISTFNIVGG